MASAKEEGNGWPMSPQRLVAASFGMAIAVGTLLLMLPIASSARSWTDPVTALFTAVSATCVTGLIVVDTPSYFSQFGELVILCLIQLGGLGIMTLASSIFMLLGHRVSLRDENLLGSTLGPSGLIGTRTLAWRAVGFTAIFESAGTLLLAWRLHAAYGYAWWQALYHGLFHAVSAFCNAGFALYTDSLISFNNDPFVVLLLAALLVLGGLGFLVLQDLALPRFWQRAGKPRFRMGLHTWIALVATGGIILVSWLMVLGLEWDGTFAGMGLADKLANSLFQAVTPRTAGFNVVDMAAVRPATHYLTILLMFIGGCPASTAGGIKVTTIAVLWATAVAMVKGHQRTSLHNRHIPESVVREALAILMLALFGIGLCFGAVLISERQTILASGGLESGDLLFEVVSAMATVGLSTGVTSALSTAGRLCIIVAMFVGRVGPLTIAVLVASREKPLVIRYPEEHVLVG